MGSEALCRVRFNDQVSEGKALLERALENDRSWYALGDAGFERKAELGGEHPEVQALFKDKVAPQMRAYIASVEEMVTYQTGLSERAQADIDALQVTGRRVLLGVGAFALISAALFGWVLTRSITRSIGSGRTSARIRALASVTASGRSVISGAPAMRGERRWRRRGRSPRATARGTGCTGR